MNIEDIATSQIRSRFDKDYGKEGKLKSAPGADAAYPTIEALIDYLGTKGFEQIGDGAFSVALHKPGTNYVLKINISPDPKYRKFIAFARKHPNNGLVPHIYKVWSAGKFFIVVTEKLDDISGPAVGSFKLLSFGIENKISDTKTLFKKFQSKYGTSLEKMTQMRKGFASDQDLKEFNDWLFDLFPWRDIHEDNVMVRPSTGQLVIIDPLSNPE